MKKLIFIITVILILSTVVLSSEPYYYYRGEKVYLEELSNFIYIYFKPETRKEQFFSSIDVDILSQLKYDTSVFEQADYISAWMFESKEDDIFYPDLQNYIFLSKFTYIGN